MNTFYNPSGKFDLVRLPLNILLIVVSALLLSIVYVALQWVIPIIYFNVFITIGFGLGIALSGYYAVRFSKIRNPFLGLVLGLLAGLAGLYSQWALFISLMSQVDGNVGGIWMKTSFNLNSYFSVLLHPSVLLQYLPVLNEVGTFSIKSMQVSGLLLWIVWVIEALIILACPIAAMWSFSKSPFSELTGEWMEEKQWEGKIERINEAMVNKDTFRLTDIKLVEPADTSHEQNYAIVTLYHAEGDTNQYMTIENVLHGVDDKGKPTVNKTAVVTHLLIDTSALAAALRK